MKKIITTTLVSGLIALSVASAASASERHRALRHVQQPVTGSIVDPRDSFAEFGAPRGYYGGSGYGNYDARVYGGAISAPAGR